MGLVSSIFQDEDLVKLKGNLGIGEIIRRTIIFLNFRTSSVCIFFHRIQWLRVLIRSSSPHFCSHGEIITNSNTHCLYTPMVKSRDILSDKSLGGLA